MYLSTVEDVFGLDVDYAMLVKIYGSAPKEEQRKYSPADYIESIPKHIAGNPNPNHISTSYIERQNLTMRMSMRRFTRLTNGFSKKVENLAHAVALHYMYYNFCRIHKKLRVTPAMEAKVTADLFALSINLRVMIFLIIRLRLRLTKIIATATITPVVMPGCNA